MKSISFKLPERYVGIDLGTDQIKIWSKNGGVNFSQAACIAISEQSGRVLAIGDEALDMEGRVGKEIVVKRLLSGSQIVDVTATKAFFKLAFKKIFGEFVLLRPAVMVSVPTNLSQTKRDILAEILTSLGMGDVYTISQPLAAAIGAGVPVADTSGCFIVQMGAGIVEGSAISMGRVVVSSTTFHAGNYISEKIAWEVKKSTLVELGRLEIEQVKKTLNFFSTKENQMVKVTGNDLKTRSPREIEVSKEMLMPMMNKIFLQYRDLLNEILAQLPPELTTDVVDKGLLLSGGLAQLRGLEEYLIEELKIPVSTIDESALATIKGIGLVLENLPQYKESLGYVN